MSSFLDFPGKEIMSRKSKYYYNSTKRDGFSKWKFSQNHKPKVWLHIWDVTSTSCIRNMCRNEICEHTSSKINIRGWYLIVRGRLGATSRFCDFYPTTLSSPPQRLFKVTWTLIKIYTINRHPSTGTLYFIRRTRNGRSCVLRAHIIPYYITYPLVVINIYVCVCVIRDICEIVDCLTVWIVCASVSNRTIC